MGGSRYVKGRGQHFTQEVNEEAGGHKFSSVIAVWGAELWTDHWVT